MPAGSGPLIASASAVATAADTAEHVLCTIPPSSWNAALGTFLSVSAAFTGAAAGTVTLRVRQGNTIAGAQIGTSIVFTAAAASKNLPGLEIPDASAFGLAQQGGQYVLTYQQSAVSLGTFDLAVLGLETIAPVI
jgi:hypothetical protein